MMPGRRALIQSGALVLLLGVRHRCFGASIVAVRVWPAPDYSRVTIESAGPLKARHALVTAPPRLVVDIDELELNGALRELVAKVQPDDPNIARIRVGQYAPGVVRLVLDLKRPIQPQVFNLPPVAAYRDRLVFDLYPAQAPEIRWFSTAWWRLVAVLWALGLIVALVYGPTAATLVELFPTRIRCTSMSLPYHVGNGWFGGLMPSIAFAMVAGRGDILQGLWYPVVVASLTFVVCALWLPETRGRDIGSER